MAAPPKDSAGWSSIGGILNWLTPATGIVQRYRIVDALLDAEIMLSYAAVVLAAAVLALSRRAT